MQYEPGITAADKLLAVTTISFDIAGLELFLPLLAGAEIVLADTATAKDGRALLDVVKRNKITMMQATPYTWRIMLEAGWDEATPLKVICGGEALPQELAQREVLAVALVRSRNRLLALEDELHIAKSVRVNDAFV